MDTEELAIKQIKQMDTADLLEEFSKCVREGMSINSVPFLWYRKEILFRMEK